MITRTSLTEESSHAGNPYIQRLHDFRIAMR
jgi:hypothetical protein